MTTNTVTCAATRATAAPLRIIAGLLLLATTACGGGGGGAAGGGGTTPIVITYAETAPDIGSATVRLQQDSTQGDRLSLILTVGPLTTPASAAAFDLTWDAAVLEYVGQTPGALFESGGAAVSYRVAPAAGGGRLVVGVTQKAGAGISGNAQTPALRLEFRATARGKAQLRFENQALIDTTGTPVNGPVWTGGAATVS